jgi:hypothetical protein
MLMPMPFYPPTQNSLKRPYDLQSECPLGNKFIEKNRGPVSTVLEYWDILPRNHK